MRARREPEPEAEAGKKPARATGSTRARKPRSAATTAGSGKRVPKNAAGQFVTKLTATITKKIASEIEAGVTPETAARLNGVHVSTFHRWISAGRVWLDDPERTDELPTPEAQFTVAIEQAIAKCRSGLEKKVTSAEDARITLETLGRRFPRDWSKRERLDVGNPEGETFRILGESDLSLLSRDEIEFLREILVKLRAGRAGGDVIEMRPQRALEAGG